MDRRNAQHGEGPMAAEARGRAPRRVLVVEDDAVLALAIEVALIDAGVADVALCPGAADAMQALERMRPDAVVLDIHLADSDDGWALAELIDLLGPRRPRIVFSTAAPEDIPPGIAAMGQVFRKPYDLADLVAGLCADAGKPGLLGLLRSAIP